MTQNIKSSAVPSKLAPCISIIPSFQIGNNQKQKVTEISQNHVDDSQINNNVSHLNNNPIYQQPKQAYNNFSSNDIESTNQFKENKSEFIIPNTYISPLIQNSPESMPQTLKSQIPIINRLNTNDSLINSPNLSNRSNIDIILNNNPDEERYLGENRLNGSMNSSNFSKVEPVITKKNNIVPHQIITTKNMISPTVNLNHLNSNNPNIFNDGFKINNTSNLATNYNENTMKNSEKFGNQNYDISPLVTSNQNEEDLDESKIESFKENDSILPPAPNALNIKSKQPNSKNKKSPAYRKVMWTHAEDQLLIKTISRHGTNNWELVSNEVAGRTRKQCRERWAGILNPSLTKQPWTTEEDETLKMLHAQYGNKWAMIAAQMKGRSTIALRNRWSFHMRHAYREVKQTPFRFMIENRNGDYCNDSNNLQMNLGMNQQMNPVIQRQQNQQQQQMQIQNQNQLQFIQSIPIVPSPYNQVQQQNICNVFPVINQPQKQIFNQSAQIPMQNLHPYPSIQLIPQQYEQQQQQQQIINAPLKVVELKNNNVNKPPNFG